eukprot:TRINITY_DN14985_c0_g1_i1.p1 TRINITY_DN14985_c0_g1~~TRINITY_DN14985_c0_g1_i1.p1  ORF type:complete len:109 (+),score=41.49 TRINITY_DN14985_c0_g1_i1:23-328(+)
MIRRPPRSTQSRSSAASDVYKRQLLSFNSLPSYRIEELVGGIDEDEGLLQRREIARELARRDEEAVKVNKRRGPISRVSCPAIVPTRPSNPMACDPFFGEE